MYQVHTFQQLLFDKLIVSHKTVNAAPSGKPNETGDDFHSFFRI